MGLFNRKPAAGDPWATAPAPHGALAIEISRAELDTVERLLRWAWRTQKSDPATPASVRQGEDPLLEMMKAWHMRAGAAVAAAEREGQEPTGLAFFEQEITTVENAVRIIEERGFAGPETEREHREFLAQLHARLGYAQAVDHLGGHPVIRRELGSAAPREP
jgi:hypothetical protein